MLGRLFVPSDHLFALLIERGDVMGDQNDGRGNKEPVVNPGCARRAFLLRSLWRAELPGRARRSLLPRGSGRAD